jgi:hypothetical protein
VTAGTTAGATTIVVGDGRGSTTTINVDLTITQGTIQ